MWEGNLLPFGRQKKFTTILTDSRQKNNYNYARGQFTTFWQIPDKKNNYNYVRGQFTTFWQIPDKKIITIMREGNLLPIDRFQTNIIIIIMWEAIYYLLTDSRQKQ